MTEHAWLSGYGWALGWLWEMAWQLLFLLQSPLGKPAFAQYVFICEAERLRSY